MSHNTGSCADRYGLADEHAGSYAVGIEPQELFDWRRTNGLDPANIAEERRNALRERYGCQRPA